MNSGNFSINAQLEKERNKTQTQTHIKRQQVFDSNKMVQEWKKFAYELKNAGDEIHFQILIKRIPEHLEGFLYTFTVDNTIQQGRMKDFLPSVLDELRERLENDLLNIDIVLEEIEQEDLNKFLTGKDKYEKMLRKNSNLSQLKTLFYLDIEN